MTRHNLALARADGLQVCRLLLPKLLHARAQRSHLRRVRRLQLLLLDGREGARGGEGEQLGLGVCVSGREWGRADG